MARSMEKKAVSKESGAIIPFRESLPAFPRWMERLDELFSDWTPLLPLLRLSEEVVPRIPPLDVYEEGGSLVVKAELPGMKKEEIDVHVADGVVTISGKKTKDEKVERKDYLRLERSAGAFVRSVKLPSPVVLEKMTATYKDGVLEVRAPKVEAGKPAGRKLEIA